MITIAKVAQFTHEVTSEHIGMCHASIDANGVTYYMVGSESGEFDASGELVEYKVSWSKKHGFTCSCKSGQVGCTNCARGFCKHILWALACAMEVKTAVAEMETAAIEAEIADREKVSETDTDDAQENAIREFYAQECVRQFEQAAFMLALPSRQK